MYYYKYFTWEPRLSAQFHKTKKKHSPVTTNLVLSAMPGCVESHHETDLIIPRVGGDCK